MCLVILHTTDRKFSLSFTCDSTDCHDYKGSHRCSVFDHTFGLCACNTMSSNGQPLPALDIPHYVPPTATMESRTYLSLSLENKLNIRCRIVDYAKLAIVDLSKANTREGLVELAAQVRDAMRDIGFFYIINHGYTQSQVVHYFSPHSSKSLTNCTTE